MLLAFGKKLLLALAAAAIAFSTAFMILEGFLRWNDLFELNRFVASPPNRFFAAVINSSPHYRVSNHSGLGWEIDPSATPHDMMMVNRCEQPGASAPKSPGVFRIITLGDSITEQGHYQRFLERGLNAAGLGKNFEVWNCGVSGYGLSQYAYYAKIRALPCRPDLILIGLELADVGGNHNIMIETKEGITAFTNPDAGSNLRINKFFYLRSAAYRYLLYTFAGHRTPESDWQKDSQNFLDRIQSFSEQNDVPVAFLIWPRLKNEYSRQEREWYQFSRRVLRSRRAHHLDLHPALPERDGPELRLYSADDIHPSREGFQRMTPAILKFLLETPQLRVRTEK